MNRYRLIRILLTGLLAVAGVRCASAQYPQGATSPTLIIDGHTLSCSSGGHIVLWRVDNSLNDGGHTAPDFSVITYNPTILSGWPVALQLWGMGHECGHAYNRDPNEDHADCWSITKGIQQGWFGPDDFPELEQMFSNNHGDIYHPPGSERIANMKKCMDNAISHEGRSHAGVGNEGSSDDAIAPSAHSDWEETWEGNKEASKCAAVDPQTVELQWSKSSSGYPGYPWVHYDIRYKNSCSKPVVCKVRIGVGNGPKGQSNFADWEETNARVTLVQIPSHGAKSTVWRLEWNVHPPHGTKTSVRMSSQREDQSGDWGLSCKFM